MSAEEREAFPELSQFLKWSTVPDTSQAHVAWMMWSLQANRMPEERPGH
jgi:hypothetical protein